MAWRVSEKCIQQTGVAETRAMEGRDFASFSGPMAPSLSRRTGAGRAFSCSVQAGSNGRTAFFLSALLVAVGPAFAAPAPKPPGQIALVNARAVPLMGLELALADGTSIARLAKPLAPGKRVMLKLGKGATCTLAVAARFEDEAEPAAETVDVCKDKSLRFTD